MTQALWWLLRAVPLRVVVSDRGLKDGTVELKRRTGGEPWTVPLEEAVEAVVAEVQALRTADR